MGLIKINTIFKPFFDPSRFYDLSEEKLNFESDTKTYWGNLGYWKDKDNNCIKTYPEACRQLCKELANTIQLKKDDLLIDVGFGCGDQLFMWLEQFKIQTLYGINISSSQVRLARQRLRDNPNLLFKKQTNKIFIGGDKNILKNRHDVQSLLNTHSLQPNKIIAVDCVYHFQNKALFMQQCQEGLVSGGMLGFSDLVLKRKTDNLFEKFMLRLICICSRIPQHQLKTSQDYQTTLNQIGFEVTVWRDISAGVFVPFGLWLKAYIPKNPDNGSWLKYRITAFFLAWLSKHDLIAYTLIGLTKPIK